MFTFTKKADYALLALSFLAGEGQGRLVGPREIARRYEIPAELLAKVMQTLARHRLVASVPGPTGGYRLARSAEEMSVAEVVEAMDGPLAIAQCWEEAGPDRCAQSRHCTLRGPLARIQEEMVRLLRETTVAEVCEPAPPLPRTFAGGTPLSMLGTAVSHPTAATAAAAPVGLETKK
ncbi:MAG TPA: Rrf2 family transcriptional regulator [Armatimonadaceae bacterium]|jgi:Rrf2 family protein|nr:Rrf2 family transcriptional regulator [Armatimonadaceae bacterium]